MLSQHPGEGSLLGHCYGNLCHVQGTVFNCEVQQKWEQKRQLHPVDLFQPFPFLSSSHLYEEHALQLPWMGPGDLFPGGGIGRGSG